MDKNFWVKYSPILYKKKKKKKKKKTKKNFLVTLLKYIDLILMSKMGY